MMCNIVCLQIVSRKKLTQQTFPFHSISLSLPLCTQILDRVILSLLHHHALSPHPQCQCHHLHHSSSSSHTLPCFPFAHPQPVLCMPLQKVLSHLQDKWKGECNLRLEM